MWGQINPTKEKIPIEGDYQRTLMSFCQPLSIWHKMNASPLLLNFVYPYWPEQFVIQQKIWCHQIPDIKTRPAGR